MSKQASGGIQFPNQFIIHPMGPITPAPPIKCHAFTNFLELRLFLIVS